MTIQVQLKGDARATIDALRIAAGLLCTEHLHDGADRILDLLDDVVQGLDGPVRIDVVQPTSLADTTLLLVPTREIEELADLVQAGAEHARDLDDLPGFRLLVRHCVALMRARQDAAEPARHEPPRKGPE